MWGSCQVREVHLPQPWPTALEWPPGGCNLQARTCPMSGQGVNERLLSVTGVGARCHLAPSPGTAGHKHDPDSFPGAEGHGRCGPPSADVTQLPFGWQWSMGGGVGKGAGQEPILGRLGGGRSWDRVWIEAQSPWSMSRGPIRLHLQNINFAIDLLRMSVWPLQSSKWQASPSEHGRLPNEPNGCRHEVLSGKAKGVASSWVIGQSGLEPNTELGGWRWQWEDSVSCSREKTSCSDRWPGAPGEGMEALLCEWWEHESSPAQPRHTRPGRGEPSSTELRTSRWGVTWSWTSMSSPVTWTPAHICEIGFVPNSTWAPKILSFVPESSLLAPAFFSSNFSVASQVFALWLLKNYFAFILLGTRKKKSHEILLSELKYSHWKQKCLKRQPASPLFGHCDTEQIALSKLALTCLYTVTCFYLLLKYFSAISYGTAFEDSCEPQLGNSFFEVLRLFIFCQWQALYALTFYTFRSYFKIYFIWRRVNLSFCTQSHFFFRSFLSFWHSAKFIRALFPPSSFPFKLNCGA